MNVHSSRLLGLGVALMLATAACGGADSESTPTDPPTVASSTQPTTVAPTTVTTTTAPVVTEPATTEPANSVATELTIEAVDNEGYSLSRLTAPTGEISVTFNNKDDGGEPHNWKVTVADDEAFGTAIAVGLDVQTVTFTIGTPGDYVYVCDVHPEVMTGVLTVTP